MFHQTVSLLICLFSFDDPLKSLNNVDGPNLFDYTKVQSKEIENKKAPILIATIKSKTSRLKKSWQVINFQANINEPSATVVTSFCRKIHISVLQQDTIDPENPVNSRRVFRCRISKPLQEDVVEKASDFHGRLEDHTLG